MCCSYVKYNQEERGGDFKFERTGNEAIFFFFKNPLATYLKIGHETPKMTVVPNFRSGNTLTMRVLKA